MGVPKFYRWVSERYPCLSETVKEFQIPEFDNLYLDMNGIVHVCSHPEDDNPHFRITEAKIFSDIMHYLEFLFRMIKPRKVFFMAVDGVAPRAKMNQQRGRRFRSAREAEELEKRAKEKGETLPTEKRFDSNCITPGTPFMVRLQEQLKYFVVKKLSTDPLWHGVRVFLSGHETPGEGEHKIMDFIRYERSQPGYDANTRHCLYGLDADLMMLGLATHEPHFSLLREEVKFGGKRDQHKRPTTAEETTFHLLHLSLFREYLDFEFSALKERAPFPYDLENVIDDWVLMGFLVGNDFIPHLPNLHINHDALPLLWKTYIDVLPTCGGYLNEGGHLNLERFEKYITALAQFDFDTFSEQAGDLKWLEGKKGQSEAEKAEMMAAAKKFRKNMKRSQNHFAALENASEDVEDFMSEEVPDELGMVDLSPEEESVDLLSDEDESGDTLDDEFRHHKRHYYMSKMEYEKVTPEVLRDQAEGYIRGLQWILLYYYEGVPSWSWFYPHHYAPYMSDVKDFKDMDIKFEYGTPFMPFEQLMAVLPSASKELLPPAYQSLMTLDSSPVIDFYPINFDTDLNGKQQDWEAVVLIPFIAENRLLEAMKTKESQLTPEERSRNCHGPCLLYEYSPEPLEPYPSALPDDFPDIAINHSKLTKIPKHGFVLPSEKLVKGLYPGVKLEVFFAGFPTLKHIPHKAELRKDGVKVFQMNSRGYNVMLTIDQQKTPDTDWVAKEYLGKEIFVGWPHLFEAKVVNVSDERTSYNLVETKDAKGKKVAQKNEIKREENDGNATNIWYQEANTVKDRYKDRLGVIIGTTDILVKALPMVGRKYVFGSHGRVTLEKQFGNRPVPFALQATIKDLAVHDSSFCQFTTLSEYLPEGSPVFMLGWPHYGCQGEVLEVDLESGRVRINLSIFEEPQLSSIINNQTLHAERYFPGYIVAQQVGISSNIISRITGTILVAAGNKELSEQQQNPHKVNIGLNLKFTKRGEEIPGYTKMQDGQWAYSQKVIEVVKEYIQKFPEMFDYISKADKKMNDLFYESQMIPKDSSYTLKSVDEYLKSLPCRGLKSMKSGADIISEGTISALEGEAERVVEINKKRQKRVKMQVKPHLLFRHVSSGGAIIPDATTVYRLFDRVVNIRQGYAVPFGLRGTVVGIHPAEVEVNTMYEVIFDEEFLGGISIRNSSKRGYRMPPSSLLNLTHGERKNGVKPDIPVPELNQQSFGGQTNRNMFGNRSYSEAANYQARNQPGFSGYQDNRGGYQDNQRSNWRDNTDRSSWRENDRGSWRENNDRGNWRENNERGNWRDDKDRGSLRDNSDVNARKSYQGNTTKPGHDSYSQLKMSQNRFNRNTQPPEVGEDLTGKVFNGGSTADNQPTFVTPKLSKNNNPGQFHPDKSSLTNQSTKQETSSQEVNQSSEGNNEFANMWKQLQSVTESSQGTSLSQAASVLPNPGSLPKTDTDTNNSNVGQTKIDVNSLFSQAAESQSAGEDKTGVKKSDKSVVQSEMEKSDKKSATKIVSNDEFAAMFKCLDENQDSNQDSNQEDENEGDVEDEGANMIKKMLKISNDDNQGEVSGQTAGGGNTSLPYGRQVSLQELFAGAKNQQPTDLPSQPTQQQQPIVNQQKRSNGYQKMIQGQPGPQQGYPPPLMQQNVRPNLPNQKPPLMMSQNQGGNRNPVMELMSFCQSLQMGIPLYDYVPKNGVYYCIVSIYNGSRFQGSMCKTKEEAAESAAGVALLQMKGSMHQMPVHPMMCVPGYAPGVPLLPQGRQFSSPNSAFSPVSNFEGGYLGPGTQGQFNNYNQRSYGKGQGQGHKDYGRGGGMRQQYNQKTNYYGNSYQQNYQGRNQSQSNQQFNASQHSFNTNNNNNQTSRQTEPQTGSGIVPDSTNQKLSKPGLTNQAEVKTQPTCVVTPFVPLQVVKKQTPQKQKKESVVEQAPESKHPVSAPSQPSDVTETVVSKDSGANKSDSSPTGVQKNVKSEAQTSVNKPAGNSKVKTLPKASGGTGTPKSGKKSKRRLAANFNMN